MALLSSDSDNISVSSEDWWMGVNRSLPPKRRRKTFRLSDSEDEKAAGYSDTWQKQGHIDDKSDLDESVATKAKSALPTNIDRDLISLTDVNNRVPDQIKMSASGLNGECTSGSDDDELLSVESGNFKGVLDKKIKDFDYDQEETFYESQTPSAVSLSPRPPRSLKEYRPSTSTSVEIFHSSDEEDTRMYESSDTPDTYDSDWEPANELQKRKKVSKKKLPTVKWNYSVPTSHYSSDSSDYEGFTAPVHMRYRPSSEQKPKKWYDPDQIDLNTNTPTTYDPATARSEDWHGDVQKTVTMLEKTMAGMPMPNDGNDNIKLPSGLVELYSHQLYALRWLSWRERQFPNGGILADEMGLGKTIEIIALIMKSKYDAKKAGKVNLVSEELAREKKCIPSRTTLVVSPLSCIPQWDREIATKGRHLTVHIFHGTSKMKSAVELAKFDVVITTYQTIASEIPKLVDGIAPKRYYSSPLKRIYWARIVLDEAHHIRNPKTKAAQAISQLEAISRWAVTGTPIHNRPEDFFSMCKFLRLTPFDDRPVWDLWIGMKAIKRGAELRLHILGKALILRRTKEEVATSSDGKVIPPKNVEVVEVQLSEEERKIYDMLMDYAQSILRKFLSQEEPREHGFLLGGRMFAADRDQQTREDMPEDIKYSHIFGLLIRLRQVAILPYLIETMISAEDIGGEEFDDMKPEHIVNKRNPVFRKMYVSSKFKQILDDVDKLRAKAKPGEPMDKVIIVSSWTSTLDILYQHLLAKGYHSVFITGRDDMNLRMDNMDRFNNNKGRPEVLLLSLMAGGIGLNLIGANHVFFVEPHWNPQHEVQAQDRVHRFGQNKNVFIKRYICEDTIESRIMDLQKQKLELADGLLTNSSMSTRGAGITLDQIKTLFDMGRRRDDV